ncbi:MAG: AgmX/PglI C-terminal domain-containing protein [Myxococcales bacterium]|nr:AgmX/PglI C-terminal domain-containing protein [Myxococcales bacterium]
MPGRGALVMTVVAALAACKSDAPSGPPGLGDRADAAALTRALVAVAERPPTERAAALTAAVLAVCGPACGCLSTTPGAAACPAANASVPAGWPALELSGRYLAEQLAAAPTRARGPLASALAGLTVPLARLDPGAIHLPTADHVRPLSLGPVLALDAQARFTVGRHPLVAFGADGARVLDPPAPTALDAGAIADTVGRVALELGDPPPPPPPLDAGTDDDLLGGFGLSGTGPMGGTGFGTIGVGGYGRIGGTGMAPIERFAFSADRAPLAFDQPVVAAAGALADHTLIMALSPRGGALAIATAARVDELPWTFRPGAPIAVVTGPVLRREAGRFVLERDGAVQAMWMAPLSPADRAALLADLAPVATTLTVEIADLTVADVVATLDLVADTTPTVRLILRRPSSRGYGGGSGPQVRMGQPSTVGDLDKAIIRRYIRRNFAKIRYCYERELLTKPGLEGTIAARFFISTTGAVASVSASGVDPAVASCIAQVIKGITFPRPKGGGGVQVDYPFEVHPTP